MPHPLLIAVTIVWLLCSCISTADPLPPEIYGTWAFELADGQPVCLQIAEASDGVRGEILWCVGSPRELTDLVIDRNSLRFHCNLTWKPRSETPKTREVRGPVSGRLSGDTLQLQFAHTLADTPDGMANSTIVGKRLPPLPARPNLEEVRFGPPIRLFNGVSLSGWSLSDDRQLNGWSVVGGRLVNDTPKQTFDAYSTYGNLVTTREFDDFRLTFEYNVPAKGNSGLYLRGLYEVQIVDRDSTMQGINGPGAIFGRLRPTSNAAKPGGAWNRCEVTLVDRHATVVLNGIKVIDNQLIHGCTGGALSADVTRPGPIMLQGDHTRVQFRDIVIEPVLSAARSTLSETDVSSPAIARPD